MRDKINIVFLVWLLIGMSVCSAQGYRETFNLRTSFMPIHIQNVSDKPILSEQAKLGFLVPIYLKRDKSQSVKLGFTYENMTFLGKYADFLPASVTSLQPLLGYERTWNNKWDMAILLTPSWNADFLDQGNNLIFGSAVSIGYRIDPELLLRFSMIYRQQFFGPQYLPLLGFDWKISKYWSAFGDLPLTSTLVYKINPTYNAGFYLAGDNYSFQLSTSRQYLKYNFINIGLFSEGNIGSNSRFKGVFWKRLIVRVSAAYAVFRTLNAYERSDKSNATFWFFSSGQQLNPINTPVSGGFEFIVSMSYRLPE